MLLFDIGANRGDATLAGINKGFDKIIAVEAAPTVFRELVGRFLYVSGVVAVLSAVSDKYCERVEFYEAEEDGLSTLNKDWLTSEDMPYNGKPYKTITVNTTTIDTLVNTFGEPDLIKIDVEGAEWSVLKGMSMKYGVIALEWTINTLKEHEKQLEFLYTLGYREFAPQFIVNHLDEPSQWYPLEEDMSTKLAEWVAISSEDWINGGWKEAGLRPTADVGMLWVR